MAKLSAVALISLLIAVHIAVILSVERSIPINLPVEEVIEVYISMNAIWALGSKYTSEIRVLLGPCNCCIISGGITYLPRSVGNVGDDSNILPCVLKSVHIL